jgi:hypothetical protein
MVIDYLLSKGIEIIIVLSNRTFKFLDRLFLDCAIKIKGFQFASKNAELSIDSTKLISLLWAGCQNLAY